MVIFIGLEWNIPEYGLFADNKPGIKVDIIRKKTAGLPKWAIISVRTGSRSVYIVPSIVPVTSRGWVKIC